MSTWSAVAAAYRRSFATLCAGSVSTLLEATAPGSRHLDVGCETGDLALAAAQEGRQVVAVDPVADMVRLTRETLSQEGMPATVLEAASPGLPLPGARFDAVTANFVVNHVPGPRATVRELARLVAPSGRVAMTIWPSAPGPHLVAYTEATRCAGVRPVPSARLSPELDFQRSADGLSELASGAGLGVERAEELRWTWHIAADDLMAGIAGGVAGPGRIHRAQTAEVRDEIETRVRELWSAWEGADGVLAFPVTAVLVVATRP